MANNDGGIYNAYEGNWIEQIMRTQQALKSSVFAPAQRVGGETMVHGTQPVVICNGTTTEAKDMTDAQQIAEAQAHKTGADAYILKPVKKVSPKRDVVTTDLT